MLSHTILYWAEWDALFMTWLPQHKLLPYQWCFKRLQNRGSDDKGVKKGIRGGKLLASSKGREHYKRR